jgi:hypothetical protein
VPTQIRVSTAHPITNAAVGVMQHDEVPAGADVLALHLRYHAQDAHGLEQRRVHAAADVADDGGLARLQLEDVRDRAFRKSPRRPDYRLS